MWAGGEQPPAPRDGSLDGAELLVVREEMALDYLLRAAVIAEALPADRLAALGDCPALTPDCPPRFAAALVARLHRRPAGPGEVERLLALFDEVAALAPPSRVRSRRARSARSFAGGTEPSQGFRVQ